jgi:lipoic acid synthetase
METVPRLYRRVRPQAIYQRSLDVLRFAKRYRPDVLTKSGLMVGLGESQSEVWQLLHDLRGHDTDVATIGVSAGKAATRSTVVQSTATRRSMVASRCG